MHVDNLREAVSLKDLDKINHVVYFVNFDFDQKLPFFLEWVALLA